MEFVIFSAMWVGVGSHDVRVVADVLEQLEDALEEELNQLLAHSDRNVLLLLVLLHHLLDLVPHLLTALLHQVEERLNVHVCHQLHIQHLVYCFYPIDYYVKLPFDLLPPVTFQ